MKYNHCYPLNDYREHVTEGKECWCNPEIDEEYQVIIHSSMDKRELYETGLVKNN